MEHSKTDAGTDTSGHKKEAWYRELWDENRELFKELIKHVLIFALLVVSMTLLQKILKLADLPEQKREKLDAVHFYMSLIVFVIFGFSFIIKVGVLEFRSKK